MYAGISANPISSPLSSLPHRRKCTGACKYMVREGKYKTRESQHTMSPSMIQFLPPPHTYCDNACLKPCTLGNLGCCPQSGTYFILLQFIYSHPVPTTIVTGIWILESSFEKRSCTQPTEVEVRAITPGGLDCQKATLQSRLEVKSNLVIPSYQV